MPTVILPGGLGNQLFQYAVGRALSFRAATPLRLETSWFSRAPTDLPSRSLHLRDFQIDATFIQEPVRDSLFRGSQFKLFDWLRKISPEAASRLCRVHKDHSPHEYSPTSPNCPAIPCYLGITSLRNTFKMTKRSYARKFHFLRFRPAQTNAGKSKSTAVSRLPFTCGVRITKNRDGSSR